SIDGRNSNALRSTRLLEPQRAQRAPRARDASWPLWPLWSLWPLWPLWFMRETQRISVVRVRRGSYSVPVEARRRAGAVDLERAGRPDGIRPIETPILPGRQPAEHARALRLRQRKPQVGLHAGQRVR